MGMALCELCGILFAHFAVKAFNREDRKEKPQSSQRSTAVEERLTQA